MRADNALRSNLSVITNGRSHSDQAPIADRASVDDGSVSNGDILTDEGRGHPVTCMNEYVFLEVCSPSYFISPRSLNAEVHTFPFRSNAT